MKDLQLSVLCFRPEKVVLVTNKLIMETTCGCF